jgi:hypothetical protein
MPSRFSTVNHAFLKGIAMRFTRCLLPTLLLAYGAATMVRGADQPAVEPGYTALFNGKDLSGWKLRKSDGRNGWTVQDGVLMNKPPSTDLVSEKEYLNFQIRYDYRSFGNSGVGLRGRYEIQIDDSFGRPPRPNGNGAIYNQLAPSQNVSKPRGEWQSIDAVINGDRITVIHNGVKTVDNFQLKMPTGIQYGDRLERESGPIILQGDHGQVDFRNIRIKELP